MRILPEHPDLDPILYYNLFPFISLTSPRPGGVLQDPVYQDHTGVDIKLNPQGWRSPHDFDTLDWNNSVLIFGCSQVWGHALEYHETLSHCLEQELGCPVINLGIMGAGPEFAVETAVQLQTIYGDIRPRAVVHVWSHYLRRHYHDPVNQAVKYSHLWDEEPDTPVPLEQLNHRAHHLWRLWPRLWTHTTTIDRTYFHVCRDLYGIPVTETSDLARDGAHAGPQTNQQLARELAQEIKLAPPKQ